MYVLAYPVPTLVTVALLVAGILFMVGIKRKITGLFLK
jgi:hypothetical protein